MNILRSLIVAFTLSTCVAFSTVLASEPRNPDGPAPLTADEIKTVFAGQIANGQDVTFEDYHRKDGSFEGKTSGGKHYGGEWWVEEGDNYICFKYLSRMRATATTSREAQTAITTITTGAPTARIHTPHSNLFLNSLP